MKLTINSEIKEILKDNKIDYQNGLTYLMCLYIGLKPDFIPESLKAKVLSTYIVNTDYKSGILKWKVDLFEETIGDFDWIKEFIEMFSKVNPDRKGSKSIILKRMKEFFMRNSSVRKDEVLEATKRYLSTVDHPKYCMISANFIFDKRKGESKLLDFVEYVKDKNKKIDDDVI